MEENEQGEMVPKKKGPWKVIDHSTDNTPLPHQGKSFMLLEVLFYYPYYFWYLFQLFLKA